MSISDIDKFEKNNGLAINVYLIQEKAKTNSVSPLRITDRKVPINDYVNLLLIEGEKDCHYAWIRNFNRLMCKHGNGHKKAYCLFCCTPFYMRYGDKKFKSHMESCRNYGGQRVILPPPGKNTVEFSDHHKALKCPVSIYADFETFNVKLPGCMPNPATSSSTNKTLHVASGFTFTVISDYFEPRTVTYSKKTEEEDVGEIFMNHLFAEEKRIINWKKANEKIDPNLTLEEEKQWEAAKTCHICGQIFLKKNDNVSNKAFHLKNLCHLLQKNRLNPSVIPSLKKVKKQRRMISLQLHPDKNIGLSDAEIKVKDEELKKFLNDNSELLNYLLDNSLDETEEEGEEFSEEDALSELDVEKIKRKGWKVRDHCHWSGNYRGAAHSGCNLAFRKTSKIPVVFHNLSGYDGHIIMQTIPKLNLQKAPQVIAKTMEKYVGFSIGKLQFMDSLQHLSSSLDVLVSNLADKAKIIGCKYCARRGAPKSIARHEKISHKRDFNTEYNHKVKNSTLSELFPILYKHFKSKWPHLPESAFEMLTRKGVYPYSYMDSLDRFTENQLPPKKSFYNDLSKKSITTDDFNFVQKLWKTFDMKTLEDLHNLYMESDVLLLSDVYENYRSSILQNYGLDPIQYLTAPSLSWSAGLKYTKAKLELPPDMDMHMMIDSALRGGISLVANQYAEANNPYMKDQYQPEKPDSYIQFVDANNLYGE